MISRSFLFIAGGIATAFILGLLTLVAVQERSPYSQQRIGGAFTMTEMTGHQMTDKDLRGKPSVLFFGYTSCPDICPTTLSSLTNVLERMGPSADQLNMLFVTVDPERDTAAQMRDYLSSFDPRIRGLTGTQAQTDAMANAYHVYHRRVSTGNGTYTVDHSSTVYLMDGTGRLAGEINYNEDEDRMKAKLTALVQPDASRSGKPRHTDLWADAARLAKQLCGL